MSTRVFLAKVISSGRSSSQVTIPHEVVKLESIENGDIVELKLISVKKAEEVPAE